MKRLIKDYRDLNIMISGVYSFTKRSWVLWEALGSSSAGRLEVRAPGLEALENWVLGLGFRVVGVLGFWV